MNFFVEINVIVAASVILPVLIGFLYYKNFGFPEKIIFLLCIIGALTEIFLYLYAYYNGNNRFLINLYTIIELFLYLLFFIAVIKYKYFTLSALTTFALFMIAYLIDFLVNDFNFMKYYSDSVESIIAVVCAFYLLFHIMRSENNVDLLSEPFFWINSGILIYFSGNIVLFTLSKFLKMEQLKVLYDLVHGTMNLLLHFSFSIAFWKTRKRI